MIKRALILVGAAVFAFQATNALAFYYYRDGTGALQQIFSFVCQTTQICPGLVQIDSTGTEKATTSNPSIVGGSNAGAPVPLSVDPTGKLNVNATASIGGFTPSLTNARATFSVTTGDSSQTLPTGTTVVVSDPGANDMFCNANGIAATSADQPITAGGGWFAFTIPAGITVMHCIGDGGATTANMLGGSGLPTGTGGGSGSGGTVDQGSAGSSTSAWFVAPGSGATFPVSGTFWPYTLNGDGGVPSHVTNFPTTQAVTQSGSWTVGQSGSPWGVNLTQLAGSALGAPSNYGTTPGTVSVQGVNAFITNSPSVVQSGSWTVAATESGTWTMQPGNTPNTTPWLFTISQGGNAAAVNGSGQLSVNCANCSGSGVSQQDATGYTQGTTDFVPIGGIYSTAISNLTTGQAGAAQLTTDRMLYTNMGKWGGTALGAPSNYGTSPGAVEVPGVNAFVTNNVTVEPGNTPNTTAWLMALNATPTIANGNGVVPTQGGSALSATNGWYGNILQGNAVLSATNPIFSSITDGTNKAAVKAASTAGAVTDPALMTQNYYEQLTLGTPADAPCTLPATTTACSLEAVAKAQANATNSAIPAGAALVGNVGVVLPAGATRSSGSTTYTTSSASITLPAIAGHTQNVCQFSVRANATAASDVTVTLSDGTITKDYTLWVAPVASGLGVAEEIFNPCLPASGTNVAWTLSIPAVGSGGVGSADITGFSQ